MKSFFFLLALSIFLFISSAYSQGKADSRSRIAILDMEGRGITQLEAITLCDRLRSEIVSTDYFDVLERGKMAEILQEQGFQQTGCTTSECAVEVGQILNVEKMIAGSIGKIGDTYTIDIFLINVETSKIELSITRNYIGKKDGLLAILKQIALDMTKPSTEETSSTWYYVAGGAAVLGTAAIILISSPAKKQEDEPKTLPPLKWPPAND